MQEEAVGSIFWHPRGWSLYREIEAHVRRRLEDGDYKEVKTPQLIDRSLWEASGHWDKFRENMFTADSEDDRTLALKPMNCPGHVQIYKQGLKVIEIYLSEWPNSAHAIETNHLVLCME